MSDEKCTARLSYRKMSNFIIDGELKDFISIDKIDPGMSNIGITQTAELNNRHGYVDSSGRVWIYYENKRLRPLTGGTIPWFSIKDGKLYSCKKISMEALEIFKKENIRDISLDTIKEVTKEKEELYNVDELNYLNSATSVYTPTIKEKDDYLKKLVKTILLIMRININKYNAQFEYKYTLTNMKTALQGDTKMSVKIFSQWMELLKTDFKIVVNASDLDDPEHLDGYVVYDSKTNSIEHIKEEDKK